MNPRLLALLVGCGSVACLDPIAPDVGPLVAGRCDPLDSNPDQDVSFDRDLLPIFTRARAEAGCNCHDPQSTEPIGVTSAGLDLSSYAAVLAGGASSASDIVVPTDPCRSVLYLKTGDAPPFGSRMPLSGPPFLSDNERMLLHDWIAEGAQNN